MRPKIYESIYTRAYPAVERIVESHLARFKYCYMSDSPLALEQFLGEDMVDRLSDAVEFMMTIDPIDREAISREVGSDIPMDELSDKTRWYLDFMSDVQDIENSIKE